MHKEKDEELNTQDIESVRRATKQRRQEIKNKEDALEAQIVTAKFVEATKQVDEKIKEAVANAKAYCSTPFNNEDECVLGLLKEHYEAFKITVENGDYDNWYFILDWEET